MPYRNCSTAFISQHIWKCLTVHGSIDPGQQIGSQTKPPAGARTRRALASQSSSTNKIKKLAKIIICLFMYWSLNSQHLLVRVRYY